MKIILIGFMGSGKTSVAAQLGGSLQLPILEMDALVLEKTNLASMHEVFARGGEMLLRETEIAIAREHAQAGSMVVSTGAGVVLNKIVLDYLRQDKGKVIFLNAAFETIEKRLADDSERPLFKNRAEAHTLYHFRLPLYLKYADQVVEVEEKSVEEIVQEIIYG